MTVVKIVSARWIVTAEIKPVFGGPRDVADRLRRKGLRAEAIGKIVHVLVEDADG